MSLFKKLIISALFFLGFLSSLVAAEAPIPSKFPTISELLPQDLYIALVQEGPEGDVLILEGKLSLQNVIQNFAIYSGKVRIWNEQIFTSKELDPDTGLYYFNARWYDPSLGRFITQDPIVNELRKVQRDHKNERNINSFSLKEIFQKIKDDFNLQNLYLYCFSNPVLYSDQSGMAPWIKLQDTEWWFRFDQSAGKGDPSHYHFLKGNDPRSSKAQFFDRRVYIDMDSDEKKINQKRHGKGGGKGGVDKDVPEDIIKKAANQKGGSNNKVVNTDEPFFGLYGVENLFDETRILSPISDGEMYPLGLYKIGAPTVEINYSVDRDKETGDQTWIPISIIDLSTGLKIDPFFLTSPLFMPGTEMLFPLQLSPGAIPGLVPVL